MLDTWAAQIKADDPEIVLCLQTEVGDDPLIYVDSLFCGEECWEEYQPEEGHNVFRQDCSGSLFRDTIVKMRGQFVKPDKGGFLVLRDWPY